MALGMVGMDLIGGLIGGGGGGAAPSGNTGGIPQQYQNPGQPQSGGMDTMTLAMLAGGAVLVLVLLK